jgi:hypothetical protein
VIAESATPVQGKGGLVIASGAEAHSTANALSGVADLLPTSAEVYMAKRPCPAFPQVRTSSLNRTPDGIRTRATALRVRLRSNRPALEIDESAGQTRFSTLDDVGRIGPISVLVLPECCPSPVPGADSSSTLIRHPQSQTGSKFRSAKNARRSPTAIRTW